MLRHNVIVCRCEIECQDFCEAANEWLREEIVLIREDRGLDDVDEQPDLIDECLCIGTNAWPD